MKITPTGVLFFITKSKYVILITTRLLLYLHKGVVFQDRKNRKRNFRVTKSKLKQKQKRKS